jgi:hypothetical protein
MDRLTLRIAFVLTLLLATLRWSSSTILPAYAATVTVTDCSTGGSLQAAINNAAPGDTVRFACIAPPGPVVMDVEKSGTIVVNKDLTIDGSGQTLILDGENTTTQLRVPVFSVSSGVSVTLKNLTIANGDAGLIRDSGGAVFNEGTLTVSNSTFTNNTASIAGAIYNEYGTLTVTNSTFTGNSADTGGGGAIENALGTATVSNSTFSGNSAGGSGGGIFNGGGSTLRVTTSTFSGNSATNGGGIFNGGTADVTNGTFGGNSASTSIDYLGGGGIFNYHTGTLSVTTSNFSGNWAGGSGGGIATHGPLSVTNSTFSGNSTVNLGGGIANLDTNATDRVTVSNSTLSGNTASVVSPSALSSCLDGSALGVLCLNGGGGALSSCAPSLDCSGAPMGLAYDILANSTGNDCSEWTVNEGPVLAPSYGNFRNDGGNLVDDRSCGIGSVVPTAALKLGALADNGGPSQTIALGAGSVAIDAASNCPSTDQRGFPRPDAGETACDAGAYEFQDVIAPVVTVPAGQTVPYGGTLRFGVSATASGGTPTLTASGLPGGLAFHDNGDGTGTVSGTVTAPVGTYTTGFTATDGSGTSSTGTVDIAVTKASLTITASSPTISYGAPVPTITPSYSGLVNGDTAPATPPTCTTTATAGSPLGTYPTNCSGAADPNYTISYTAGALTIARAVLTITASSPAMTYGDPVPAITPSYSGFVNGDGPGSLATPPSCTAAATAASHTGTYATTCSGAVAANYTISYTAGTISVHPRAVTLTADNQSMTYGGGAPTFTAGSKDFVNGDTVASLTGLTCTSKTTGHVGTYPITCDGSTDPDYTITYKPGTLTITPAALTITASSPTITYDGSVPAITPDYAGLVNGDKAPTTPPACTSTAPANGAAGTYTTSCTGAADADYSITYKPGTLTITKAPLTITASSPTITYDGSVPAVAPTYSGLMHGDTAPAAPPTCSSTAPSSGDAGTYTTSCSGAADPNYSITYKTGTLTINPAALTITADDKGPVQYSDALPTLTWQYSGFVHGEGPSVLSGTTSCSTTATTATLGSTTHAVTSPAGTYPITCSGQSSGNYTITYQPGTLTVTQENAAIRYTGGTWAHLPSSTSIPLTATVWDSAARGYGGSNPESGSTATIGDVTTMDVEFDIYPATSCLSGTPAHSPVVPVSSTSTPGVGTAHYTFSQSTDGSFCVVARVVGATGGSTNQYYTAQDTQVVGIAFYTNGRQFAIGTGSIHDAGSSTGAGRFTFTARYWSTGAPAGALVYSWYGTYHGVAADFSIKSTALTALSYSKSSASSYTAMLQGTCSYTVVSAVGGSQLYSEGNDACRATATDGDAGLRQNPAADSFALTIYQSGNSPLHPIAPTPLASGNIVMPA